MKLTVRQIERLVKQGEVVHTECKDASGGLPDSLWESYSAFANTDGGVILLGAKEVGGKFSIADYHGRRGIVIEKQAQTISFSNPGVFRVNKAVAVEGGTRKVAMVLSGLVGSSNSILVWPQRRKAVFTFWSATSSIA